MSRAHPIPQRHPIENEPSPLRDFRDAEVPELQEPVQRVRKRGHRSQRPPGCHLPLLAPRQQQDQLHAPRNASAHPQSLTLLLHRSIYCGYDTRNKKPSKQNTARCSPARPPRWISGKEQLKKGAKTKIATCDPSLREPRGPRAGRCRNWEMSLAGGSEPVWTLTKQQVRRCRGYELKYTFKYINNLCNG